MLTNTHIIAATSDKSIGEHFQSFFQTAQAGFDTLGPFGGYLLAILVFLVGRMVARGIRVLVYKGLQKTDADDKIARMVGHQGAAEGAISSFVYYILLLFLSILALGVAGLDEVSDPLKEMLGGFLGFIPNLVGAGVLLYFVLLVAKVVKNLLSGVMQAGKLDERLGADTGKTSVSNSLAMALYCFIVLLFTPAVLAVLGLDSLSEPVGEVVNSILSAVPNIIIACVLIAAGILIGQIARRLVTNLLDAAGANKWPAKLGLDVPEEGSCSVSGVVGLLVMISVAVLMVGSAINVLNISLLAGASEGFVSGYFNILVAVIIFGAGLLLSKFAYTNLADKNATLAKAAKLAIIVVTTVVALQRSNLAPELTGLPFIATICAIAFAGGVGGAIALGFGGREFVSRWLEKKG